MKTFTKVGKALLLFILLMVSLTASPQMRNAGATRLEKAGTVEDKWDLTRNTPQSSSVKKEAGNVVTLVSEDFSKMTTGSEEKYDVNAPLAPTDKSSINSDYTQQPGWHGYKVYPAGGSVCIEAYGRIYTPIGDYSGTLTIKAKVKNIGAGKDYLGITIYKGFNSQSMLALATPTYQYNLISPDGEWHEITFVSTNLSSDADGFILIEALYGNQILLDDVIVTSEAQDILAQPITEYTDYKRNGFTINWTPVNHAEEYVYNLYDKVYNDGPTSFKADFEGIDDDASNLSQEWELYQSTSDKVTEEGQNGSRAIKLHNGDYLATPNNNNSPYTGLKFWGHFVDSDLTDQYGYIKVWLYIDNQWEDYGVIFGRGKFEDGYTIDIHDLLVSDGFPYNYYAAKIEAYDVSDDSYFVLDNVECTTAQGFDLVIDSDNCGSTDATTHTFTGLNPDYDHYYTLQARNGDILSEEVYIYVFGIEPPQVNESSDIDSNGAYTANWEPVREASGYTVTNYIYREAEADTDDYVVLEEDFDLIDENITNGTGISDMEAIGNYEASLMDEYTNSRGWTGVGNAVAQGMMGVETNPYAFYYIQTPELYLANDSEFTVHLKAYGYTFDPLSVALSDGTYQYVEFTQIENESGGYGYADTKLVFKSGKKSETLQFLTKSGNLALIDYVKITQDVKAGDIIPIYEERHSLDSETHSYTFTALDPANTYAFTVRAHRINERESCVSEVSDFQIVKLSESGVDSVNGDVSGAYEIGRYTIDGLRVSQPTKGINIIKMSDGSVKKVLVK